MLYRKVIYFWSYFILNTFYVYHVILIGGQKPPLFQKLSSKKTNITFENTLTESDTLNYFLYPYIYMGGGVSVGDFNNDGLTDIYLVGNMVPDRLYLNRGNFIFEDVTEISNTGGG